MWFPEIFERFNNFKTAHNGQKAGICEVSQLGVYNETLQYSQRVCEPAVNDRVFIETLIIGLSCIPSSISLSFFMAKLGKKYVLGELCNLNFYIFCYLLLISFENE